MGTRLLDTIETVEDDVLGRRAKIDIWDVLKSKIVEPVAIRGYVDVTDCIWDNVPIAEVRDKLSKLDSSILIFDSKKFIDSKRDVNDGYVNSFMSDINGDLQSRTAPLEDYEKSALCYLIFKQIGKWENKIRLLNVLLAHFKLENKYRFNDNVRVLYDTESIDLRIVSSVTEFSSELEAALEGKNNQIFFRGHGSVSYKLLPSLFRNKKFYENERQLYLELLSLCPQEFSALKSHIDILAEMQHYGLPTRLLDVTSNALTALYFACESKSSKAGEVVMLEIDSAHSKYYQDIETVLLSSLPLLGIEEKKYLYEYARNGAKTKIGDAAFEKLKAEVRTERGYSSMREHLPDLLEYYLVSPQKLNRRIMNQDGAFILCGLLDEIYSSNPLDVENIENYSFLEKLRVEVNGKRIILIVKNKDDIMKQLNVYGINQTRIYPEIDKVAEYIKNRLTRGC